VRGVQTDELDAVWPRIRHLVLEALEYCNRDYALDDVLMSLRGARRQLFVTWPDCASMGITQIEERPCRKVLLIFAYAGRLAPDWKDIMANLKRWGASQGCSAIELQGRPGWSRVLRDWTKITHLRQDIAL
jgi:hypothetical protein